MLEILRPKLREKLTKGERKPTLALEEMLLAALEYWHEYRTYAHISASYGIHESNMHRLIKWAEDVLIKDGAFSLSGKKALLKSDVAYEVVRIDVLVFQGTIGARIRSGKRRPSPDHTQPQKRDTQKAKSAAG